MKIGQLHIEDYVSTIAGNGYITGILRRTKEVRVKLDALSGLPPATMKASLIKKIITPKVIYVVRFYLNAGDQIEDYSFNTLKEANDFLKSNKAKRLEAKSQLAEPYALTKRDRDTYQILEEIIF